MYGAAGGVLTTDMTLRGGFQIVRSRSCPPYGGFDGYEHNPFVGMRPSQGDGERYSVSAVRSKREGAVLHCEEHRWKHKKLHFSARKDAYSVCVLTDLCLVSSKPSERCFTEEEARDAGGFCRCVSH